MTDGTMATKRDEMIDVIEAIIWNRREDDQYTHRRIAEEIAAAERAHADAAEAEAERLRKLLREARVYVYYDCGAKGDNLIKHIDAALGEKSNG